MDCEDALHLASAGNSRAAKIPMMLTTTSSSISVNAAPNVECESICAVILRDRMQNAGWRKVLTDYSHSFCFPGRKKFAFQNAALLTGRLPEDRELSVALFYEQIRLDVVSPSRHQWDRW
jgi:hypothetical protein